VLGTGAVSTAPLPAHHPPLPRLGPLLSQREDPYVQVNLLQD